MEFPAFHFTAQAVSVTASFRRHMAANCHGESHSFNGDTARNKSGTRIGSREEKDGCESEKETGRHDEQPCVFHDQILCALPFRVKEIP
jgi:hypothetical protein